MKIIKIVAIRCQILRLKCTKFNFGWGSTPDPAEGAYGAPPGPLAGFKGPTSKGRRKERWKWREGKGPVYFFLRIYAHDSVLIIYLSIYVCSQIFAVVAGRVTHCRLA